MAVSFDQLARKYMVDQIIPPIQALRREASFRWPGDVPPGVSDLDKKPRIFVGVGRLLDHCRKTKWWSRYVRFGWSANEGSQM
jgi:hypothetical protein